MNNRETRLEEKKHTSSKVSDLVRYIAFGLVAVTYSLFTSDARFAVCLLDQHKSLMLWASFCGGSAVAFDYLQFLCGYLSTNKALRRVGESANKYDDSWLSYRFRIYFFWLKQFLAGIGLLLFCYAMIESAINL